MVLIAYFQFSNITEYIKLYLFFDISEMAYKNKNLRLINLIKK